MEMSQREVNDILILSPKGNLDFNHATSFQETASLLIEKGAKKVLIDFSELFFISSAGLRVLIVLTKLLQQKNGALALSSLNEQILEVFSISGFHKLFAIYSSEEEALKNF
ncbi:MAG: STAS domain-containing protein [Ignavibacteriaceae bacterium]|jgi:anti-anti-sigma factor|nr:STAS domain-containing protein [Ignavibacteriaceae bacterium]